MSTVDKQQGIRQYRTVPELLARERAGFSAHRVAEPATPRALTPVAELLRREGVDFGGDNARTVRLPAVMPAPAAPAADDARDVDDADDAAPAESRRSRMAAVGSAAALFGLTVAGFLAIKPAVDPALLPGSGDPNKPGDNPPPYERQITQNTTKLNRAAAPAADADDAPSGSNAALGSRFAPAPPTSTPTAVAPAQDESPEPAGDEPAAATSTPPADNGKTSKPPKPPADGDDGTDPSPGAGDQPEEEAGLLDPVEDAIAPVTDPVLDTVSGVLG